VHCDLKKLDINSYDMVVFYSPADIKSLTENFPEFQKDSLLFATYGQTTLKALKAAKFIPTVVAPTPEAPSIARALALYFEQK
jgi:uroporphyrinogen-III synthase